VCVPVRVFCRCVLGSVRVGVPVRVAPPLGTPTLTDPMDGAAAAAEYSDPSPSVVRAGPPLQGPPQRTPTLTDPKGALTLTCGGARACGATAGDANPNRPYGWSSSSSGVLRPLPICRSCGAAAAGPSAEDANPN
jgi:hypothetical protein